jgi:mannose-6-phosphate isomerase
MTIEHARAHAVPKPWGVADLRPWSDLRQEGNQEDHKVGEIWFERSGMAAADSSLLLKLLFTSQSLSIQVHPDDKFALSIGLPRGKSEAWYVLSATPEAKVALGLNRRLTPQQLRDAIDDGSISNLVVWQKVSQGEVIFVPAGTIHAIGAGLVIAELQQRSDATFRVFDHGRKRELQVDSAVAVANTSPAVFAVPPSQITDERTLLVANPHFVFERLTLAPNSAWCLAAERETWLLVLSGGARVGSFDVGIGDAIFAQTDRVVIRAGTGGMVCLAAYTGDSPISHLLQGVGEPNALDLGRPDEERVATSFPQTKAGPANGHPEIVQ